METPERKYEFRIGPEDVTPNIIVGWPKRRNEDVELQNDPETTVAQNLVENHEDVFKTRQHQVRKTLFSTPNKRRLQDPIEYDVNSFEYLPNNSPPYPYVRDAVKEKWRRRQLPGQECDKCQKFYEMYREQYGDTQTNALMEKCSRHRYKYKRPSTPPGFWNPTFSSSDEDDCKKQKSSGTPPGYFRVTCGRNASRDLSDSF